MAAAALIVGCGDKDNPADGDGSGTADESGDTAGDSGGTTMMPTTGVDDSGSGGGSMDQGDSESDAGTAEGDTDTGTMAQVTVSGTVEDLNPLAAMVEIQAADISVYGDDTLTAQSNVTGEYEIGPFDANTWATLIVAPSNDYVGSVIPVEIGDGPLQEDELLSQISREFIMDQITLLEPMMPEPADLDQSIVIVRLLTKSVLDDGVVTVNMSPAPAAGTFYSPNPMGAPELDNSDLQFVLLPVVVFFNVAPGDPGAYSFTFDHSTATCTPVFQDAPYIGEHITLVDVTCE